MMPQSAIIPGRRKGHAAILTRDAGEFDPKDRDATVLHAASSAAAAWWVDRRCGSSRHGGDKRNHAVEQACIRDTHRNGGSGR